MQPSDRNIHKLFSIETLMHTNTSSKTTHNIKTMLYMLIQGLFVLHRPDSELPADYSFT
jgi:hypothetical protein